MYGIDRGRYQVHDQMGGGQGSQDKHERQCRHIYVWE